MNYKTVLKFHEYESVCIYEFIYGSSLLSNESTHFDVTFVFE